MSTDEKATDGVGTPVTVALDALDVSYRTFRHPGPIHSLEQAAQERGQQPQQVVRSLLFQAPGQGYVMVLAAGPEQVSWRALRRHLSVSRVRMAKAEEVFQATGYRVGAVSPLGLSQPIPVIVDSSVTQQEEVSIGSGVRGTTVILRTEDLMRALEAVEVVDLRE